MTSFQLLTIIAEETLAAPLENEISELGARGYTVIQARGKSGGHVRDNPWEGENIQIETVVTDEVCRKIVRHLEEKYFDRYALIAFHHPVQVVRSEHFK